MGSAASVTTRVSEGEGRVTRPRSDGSIRSFPSTTTANSESSLSQPRKALSERVLSVVPQTWMSILFASEPAGHRRIQHISNFSERYELRQEVMPATHEGMEVRHALRRSDNQRVVVKIRSKKLSFVNRADTKEWRASTEMMLNLPKTNCLAQLHEVLEDSTRFFIVMEYIQGDDLFEALDCHGHLPVPECRKVIRQLLEAVAELHSRGCIHKDLKLENVMVTNLSEVESFSEASTQPDSPHLPTQPPTPVVKLIDFDTVKEWAREASPKNGESILGTNQYISQEAYAGRFSPASDMFAVGVICYKMLTGKFPFDDELFDDKVGENYVGHAKMKEMQDRVKQYHIDWTLPPFESNNDARDFCRSLLNPNAVERPLAVDALRHAWLSVPSSKRPVKTHFGCSPHLDELSSQETYDDLLPVDELSVHDDLLALDDLSVQDLC